MIQVQDCSSNKVALLKSQLLLQVLLGDFERLSFELM